MWLHCPWFRSAREAADSTKESEPLSDDMASWLARRCTWRGKHSEPRTWSARWRRGGWMRLLSGPISGFLDSKNLTGFSNWLAQSSSQPDFPALRGARPDSARASKTSDGSGTTSLGSFATYDPASSRWNAPQASLLAGSNTFSGPWPKSGSMRNGIVFERPTSAPRIRELAGGASLPVSDSSGCYPTPTASTYGTNQGGSAGRTGPVRESLETWARQTWATPTAKDSDDPVSEWGRRKLCREAANWPTARASDGTRKRSAKGARKDVDRKGGPQDLEAAVALFLPSHPGEAANWPTATAGDSRGSGGRTATGGKTPPGTSLVDACLAFHHADPETKKPGDASSPIDLSLPRRSQEPTNRRLSALFVAWLMGWWRESEPTC